MRAARPYAEKIRKMIGHLRQANLDYKHPFMLERPVQRVGIIVISTDRGLCGSLNVNLFKATLASIREAQRENAQGGSLRHRLQGVAIFPPPPGGKVAGPGHASRAIRRTSMI